jgi:hypothetical protein
MVRQHKGGTEMAEQKTMTRDELYNVILRAVKDAMAEHDMPIGLVRAVLNEVDSSIAAAVNNSGFQIIHDRLQERKHRE